MAIQCATAQIFGDNGQYITRPHSKGNIWVYSSAQIKSWVKIDETYNWRRTWISARLVTMNLT